jgi:hypothetical protein
MSLAADPCNTLIRELLEWLGPSPRPYAETLEAWRTSCPRLPVWERPTTEGSSCGIARRYAPHLGEAWLRSTSGRSVAVARLIRERVLPHRLLTPAGLLLGRQTRDERAASAFVAGRA